MIQTPVISNNIMIHMNNIHWSLRRLMLTAMVLTIAACAATAPIVRNNDGTYLIQQEGEWGYHDLDAAKKAVLQQATDFATKQGKAVEVVKEEVTPQSPMGVYPSFDGAYRLTFRLRDPGVR